MAYTSNSMIAQTLTGRLRTLVQDFAAEMIRRKIFRTTLTELRGLSDAELADLGLSRSELRSVAHEAAYTG